MIIDGRYEVYKTLSGGMGSVHFCFDKQQDDLPVAIKTIKPDFLPDPSARSKFLREANIWIQLGLHPNIVHAHKVVFVPETHDIYIVIELITPPYGLPDPSLRAWILAGHLNLNLALKISLQVIRGMKYSTEVIPDLVHRDLKPENILVGVNEIAKINDFGIASSGFSATPLDNNSAQVEKVESTHSAIGTIIYMSPEQCLARPIDCRSDIYTFGLILFELLTGELAIDGEYAEDIIASHILGTALKRAESEISNTEIRKFIQKCVAPKPEDRFQNWKSLEGEYLNLYTQITGQQPLEDDYPIDVSLSSNFEKVNSYLAIGSAYIDAGEFEKATEFTQKSLEMAQRIAAPRIEAAALSNLGVIFSQMGMYEQAIHYYEGAERLNFKLYDLANQAINLGNLGGAYQKIGQIETARDYFYKSLVIAKTEEIPGIQAAQLGNLAISFMEQAEFQKAAGLYKRAIEILSSTNAEIALTTHYGNLANVLFLLGDMQAAEENYTHAYDLAVKHGIKPQQSFILGNIANIFIVNKDYDRALMLLQEAISISNEAGDKSSLCKQLATVGSVLGSQKEYNKAVLYLQQALSIANEINDQNSLSSIYLAIGNLHLEANRLMDAEEAFRRCVDISHQINNRHSQASALGNLGKVQAALLKFDGAIESLDKSMMIAKEIGSEEIQGRAAWTIGIIFEMSGMIKPAIDYMRFAVRIFRNRNLPEY